MSKPCTVTWIIDAPEECETAEEAARWAWETMRKPDSTANVFTVIDEDGNQTQIDLQELDEEKAAADTHPCDCCGTETSYLQLDGKPEPTWWLRIVRFFRGQEFMLRYAADRGYDFDRLEGGDCYGPGYAEM